MISEIEVEVGVDMKQSKTRNVKEVKKRGNIHPQWKLVRTF